ncbi:phosphatidate cytidylyltransferase [Aurantibacter sp.]|uniref:phosphatidate cytidylyltransferase n=1 Tax=Aurantibacter sp. TaxID=2807103 RepID=UPI0035C862F0
MRETITRAFSGFIFISLLIFSFFNQHSLILIFYIFGIICISEFKKLIALESKIPYIAFTLIYFIFGYWNIISDDSNIIDVATQILQVFTIFVQLFLIRDLFSEKTIPLFTFRKYLLTIFYLSSAFVFLPLITNYNGTFDYKILLCSFILIWVNDTFAYLVGKNFGKQKLFSRISPKKTVEGFLGGVLFACITSYFIFKYTQTLTFTSWLILSIIISSIGTIGDLIESKFKRQANVKDSGSIMPGHGGLLDRLDSIIFAAPFIYLFLRITTYVS